MSQVFDLRVNGGTLMDGSGGAGLRGDLGIRAGRIVAMGKVEGDARQSIDAEGMVVAPGFVDMHTHYDAQVFWDPSVSPSSRFGVTTIIGGNCGFSIAPLNGKREDAEYMMRMLAKVEAMPLEALKAGAPWDWGSFADYLARHEGRLAVNAGFMVGHSALRRAVMSARAVGESARPDEIRAMQELLRESLAAGGMGLSSTIALNHHDGEGKPVPSRYATREEMLALASVLSEYEGTSLEFLPKISNAFAEDQLSLMTDLSLAAERPLNWNVLIPNSRFPEIYKSQLGASDYAAARGARVVPLVMAQVLTFRQNFITCRGFENYPGWKPICDLPHAERKKALADPEVRRKLDAGVRSPEMGTRSLDADWGQWTFDEVINPANKRFEGRKVGDVARELGKAPFDTLLDVAIEDDLRTSLGSIIKGTDDETWRMRAEAWLDERTIVGASDAGAHLDGLDTFASCALVLSVGVRERKLLSMEEAVRQLTSVPAELIGLKERGRLRTGYCADVVVFDPATVGRGPVYTRHDLPAGASRLYADPLGVKHVVVNGEEIVREGEFCDRFPGQVLRSGKDTRTVSIPKSAAKSAG
jgi:N-acyl-D-aspartate/D-glutamate deacylase